MVVNPDLREFIKLLNENKVRYLIVGRYAVAYHGHPRHTKDLDIWTKVSEENAAKLFKTIKKFGFGSFGLREKDFLNPDQIVQLGNPPNRIELFFSLKGVNFEKCYASRVRAKVNRMTINFIDIKGLKRNKKATGRLQDLADLENLK